MPLTPKNALRISNSFARFLLFCRADILSLNLISGRVLSERLSGWPLSPNLRFDRPYSYSRYWTGTSLQVRLMQEVFSNVNDIPRHEPPLEPSSSPIPRI